MDGKMTKLALETAAVSAVFMAIVRRNQRRSVTPLPPGAMTREEIAEVTQYFGEMLGDPVGTQIEWPSVQRQLGFES